PSTPPSRPCPADLPVQAGGSRAVPGRLDLRPDRLVVSECLCPTASQPEQIGQSLSRYPRLGIAGAALTKGVEGAPVVADRVVVRVDRARPIAGGEQVAGALELVRAQAPMAAEGFEIAQALGMETDLALERVTRPLVDLGPTGQQEVLIHHLVHERVHEPEPATPTPVSHRLDQIVLHQPFEGHFG